MTTSELKDFSAFRYVPGFGASTAKLAIVGEAPGAEEELAGRPFVGQSGKMVRGIVENAGMNPEEAYYTNVVKVRPPGNNIDALNVLQLKIEDFLPHLWAELDTLKPNCILAIGGVALKALTGYDGIQKYRGSILQAKNGVKVVSTIHPASLLHAESAGMSSWKDLTFIQWDANRAVAQSRFREYNLPRRHLKVCRSFLELDRYLHDYRNAFSCALDIETYKTFPICIAIAFNRNESLSIPLFAGWEAGERVRVWRRLADFLSGPIAKIGQNFKFDQQLMECCNDYQTNFGFEINNFYFDTMLGFRTLYPELPAKLEFIASVLTEEPYWKEEGKSFNPKKDSLDKLLLYNAKDAAVTFECYEEIEKELLETNTLNFFYERVMPLHDFYRRMERKGILRDLEARKLLKEKYELQRQLLETELQILLENFELDEKVTFGKGTKLYNSPQKVAKLLFVGLGLPQRKDTADDTLSGLARNGIKAKKDEPKKRIIQLILDLRKVGKTIGTYINAEHFPDGRLRTSVRIALETGRTATQTMKVPITTENYSMAFQTITKHGDIGNDLRSQFIPDPGKIFLEPDLSQAESRVIAILSNDENQIKLFHYGIDIHRLTAAWIFGHSVNQVREFYQERDPDRCREIAKIINRQLKEKIPDHERQLGKTFRHAGEGGMEKARAAELTNLSNWRAGELLEKFHANSPCIRDVYYPEIIRVLQENDRILVNPFERRRQFLNKWGDELFKEAYRQLPQSTVSDHLKFSMLRISSANPSIEFLEESHDSFLCQVDDNEQSINEVRSLITKELETPINFSKCSLPRGELVIPCEIKKGYNWEKMVKL